MVFVFDIELEMLIDIVIWLIGFNDKDVWICFFLVLLLEFVVVFCLLIYYVRLMLEFDCNWSVIFVGMFIVWKLL